MAISLDFRVKNGLAVATTATISGTTIATTTQTGALIVAGGVGIGGNLHVGGEIVAPKLTIQLTTVTTTSVETDDIFRTYNTTNSVSTTTGALQVSGGAGIGRDVWIGGTLNVAGNITGRATTATNITGGTAGQVPYQSAPGVTLFYGPGTAGQLLVSAGAAAPVYTNTASIRVGSADAATNVSGGTAGQLHYQSGVGATAFVGPGSAGQILVSAGATAPVYTNTASIRVGAADAATNLSAGTAQSIVYQSAAGTTAFLAAGSSGQLLQTNGSGSPPSWVNATGLTIGFATTATNLSGGVIGQIPIQSNTGTTAFIPAGSTGQLLQAGTNTATFVSTSTIRVGSADAATNVSGGTAGQLHYQSGVGATAFAGPGTAGQLLVSAGAAAPVYTNTASIFVGAATASVNLFGGTAGQLAYQSGANTTAFAGPGTAGQILVSAGAAAPVYTNTASIRVGSSDAATNLSGGAAGQIHIQSGSGTSAFIPAGTAGQLLQAGTNTATFVSTSTIRVGSSDAATNVSGGTAGQLHYQSATGVTAFAGPGSAGQLLVSGGTSAPTYTNTASIRVGSADASTNISGGSLQAIVYQSSTGTTAFLTAGSAGQILQTNGVGSAPTWVTPTGLTAGLATTATNLAGGTAGQVPYQSAPGVTTFYGPGTAGQILVSNGAAAPVYTNTASIAVAVAGTSTNIAGGLIGQIPIQGAAGSTVFISTGTVGQLLQAGTNTATFVNTSTIRVGSANAATNISAGTTGQLVYQSGVGATGFVGPGTAGQLLVSAGAAIPVYTNTASIFVGAATRSINLFGGTAGQLHYQSGPDTTAFVGPGTAGQILVSAGATAPVYTNTASIRVGSSDAATNLSAGTAQSIVYQSAAGTTAFLAAGTAGQVLQTNSTGSPPSWVNVGTLVAGTATNIAGGAIGRIPIQSNTGTTAFIPAGTAGQLLQAGTNTATFVSTSTIRVGSADAATNLSAGTAQSIVYQSAAGTTAFLAAGSAGQVLQTNGTGTAPTWVNIGTLAASTATNIAGGTAGQVPYQTAPGVTSFYGPGTAGNVLVSGGTGAPVYQNTLSLTGTTVSSNTQTGALVVAGGVGIGGNLYVGGEIVASKLTIQLTTVTTTSVETDDIFRTYNTSNATSTSTGALQISGGAGIGRDVWIGGTLNVSGSITGTITTATRVANAHSAGTGLSGANFDGSTPVTWTLNTATLMQTSVNIAGGLIGQIPIQGASGTTVFISTGTAGQLLQAGTNTATFVSTASIAVAVAGTATNIAGGTVGQLHYQTGPNATGFVGPGTVGQILVSGGAAIPVYTNTSTIRVGSADAATNLSAGTAQSVVYQSAAGTTAFLAAGTSGQILQTNGAGSPPTWVTPSGLTAGSASTASNLALGTAGQVPYQTAPGVTNFFGPGTVGQILLSGGTSGPSYTNTASVAVAVAGTSTNLSLGAIGQIPIQTAAGATAFIPTGTAGQLLQAGTNTATFVTTSSIAVAVAGTATNIAGGTIGQLHYQTGPNATGFVGPGTVGQILVSGGAAIPVYTNTASIAVAVAGTSTNLSGGTAQAIPYQTGAGATTFLAAGTSGQILQTNGAGSPPSWVNQSSLTIGSATTATNIAGGAAGRIPIQSNTGTTAFIPAGTAGQLLQAGTNTSTFVNTSTIRVGAADAATNLSAGTAQSIVYQSAAGTTAFLAAGTAGQVLQTNSTGSPPTWVNVGTLVAGTATNITGGAIGQIPIQSNTSTTAFIPSGSAGQLLQAGINTATFVSTSTIRVGSADAATNLSAGTAQAIPYQTGAGATTFLAAGTSGQILQTNGAGSPPSWVNQSSLSIGSATTATNIAGGAAGRIPIQSSTGTTAFIPTGTAGQLLQAGSSTATFVNTSTIRVGAADAATNLSAGTAQSIVYQSAAGTTAFLAAGSAGQVLQTNGVGTAPTWVNAGTLAASTATNLAGGTAGQVPYQTAPGVTSFYGPGTAGQILVSGGTSGPSYTNTASIAVAVAGTSTNLSGGTAQAIPYQTGAGATTFLAAGTAGQILQTNGTGSPPSWVNQSSLAIGSATTATNLAGGAAGRIPIQSNTGTTAFIPTGTAGQLLQAQTGNTATFVNTASLAVAVAGTSTNLSGGSAQAIPYQTAAGATAFLSPGTTGQILQTNSTGSPPSWVSIGNLTAGTSTQVLTVQQTSNASYFPVFVDSNNASATAESLFTTSSFVVNPSTGNIALGTAPSAIKLDVQSAAGDNANATLRTSNGSAWIQLLPSSTGGSWNPIVSAGDKTIIFSNGTIDTGNLVIAPWSNTVSGIKITTAGDVSIGGVITPTSRLHVDGTARITGVTTMTNTTQATSTVTGALQVSGGIGVGRDVWVGGSLFATVKSFVIDHPTKPGKKLRYGSLEGPEHGVYVRGKLTGENVIKLPDYWEKLVDPDSITVNLTPIGRHQNLYVEDIVNNTVIVGNGNLLNKEVNCYFTIFGERRDIDKLETEI